MLSASNSLFLFSRKFRVGKKQQKNKKQRVSWETINQPYSYFGLTQQLSHAGQGKPVVRRAKPTVFPSKFSTTLHQCSIEAANAGADVSQA